MTRSTQTPRRADARSGPTARSLARESDPGDISPGLFIIRFGTMHIVVAAAPTMDVEATVFQVREGPAEITAAPIRLFGDFGGNLLCKLRIIGKDEHACALVPERQAAIVIRGG